MNSGSSMRWGREEARALADLVGRMRTLLARAPRRVRARFVLPPDGDGRPEAVARLLYDQRRLRAEAFGDYADLFTEPAWDLLLDVFIARSEGRIVSVSAAAIGACVPTTTALRCVRMLEARGLVATVRHPADRRMRLVHLTPMSTAMIVDYLALISDGAGLGCHASEATVRQVRDAWKVAEGGLEASA